MRGCVWTVPWLYPHVFVSDYVKKTLIEVWTGMIHGALAFFLMNVFGLGGQRVWPLKTVMQPGLFLLFGKNTITK